VDGATQAQRFLTEYGYCPYDIPHWRIGKMTTAPLKQARMEFKTTGEVKGLLAAAANFCGVDLTAFVINAAAEKARAVLTEQATLRLSASDHARFMAVLSKPPKPTKALRKLMALPELSSR
jgi:uncharacterized protein (DUF1778 family)